MFWSWISFGVAVGREHPLKLRDFKDYLALPLSNRCLPATVMVACQERTTAMCHYAVKGPFSRHHYRSTKVSAYTGKTERCCLLQTVFSIALFLVTFLSLPIYLYPIILCYLWGGGEKDRSLCSNTTDSEKLGMERLLSWLITSNGCVGLWMGSLFLTHVLSQGNRQRVVHHGRASITEHLTKQENQTDRLRAGPSFFHCWRQRMCWWL